MGMDMRIEIDASGRARARDGAPGIGWRAAARLMAGQGKGRARGLVKQKAPDSRKPDNRQAGREDGLLPCRSGPGGSADAVA